MEEVMNTLYTLYVPVARILISPVYTAIGYMTVAIDVYGRPYWVYWGSFILIVGGHSLVSRFYRRPVWVEPIEVWCANLRAELTSVVKPRTRIIVHSDLFNGPVEPSDASWRELPTESRRGRRNAK
jgi:hypothetical protein